MAVTYKPVSTRSMQAEIAMTALQYKGVKQGTAEDQVNDMAALTDKPLGILMNDPPINSHALVLTRGIGPGIAAETLVAGDAVRIDAAGDVAKFEEGTDTTAYVVGTCTKGGADGELVECDYDFPNAQLGA